MGPLVERTAVDGSPSSGRTDRNRTSARSSFAPARPTRRSPPQGSRTSCEHLALFTAGRRKFDVNGLVDESATVFWASGTREEVCGFLSDVAQALGSISLDRLETERRVLLTEAQARGPHPLGILFGCRFGHAGFGLVNSSELGLYKFVDVTPRELAFELADVIRARAG